MREAIIHLDNSQLEKIGIADVITAARDAGLRDITELVCHGAGGIVLLQVASAIPADEFDEFDSVVWWEKLAADSSGLTYLCKINSTEIDDFPADEHGLTHDISAVGDEGIDLSIVGSQEEIRESVALADDAGMNVALQRLSDYRGRPSVLDGLTDRQQEIIEAAYAVGYYDVPREASVDVIAEEVDLDPSTVTDHIQRAERNLLTQVLGPREDV